MHQIKGEIFQLVYSFLTCAYKHPAIHGAQTSARLTRDHEPRGTRSGGFCHIWLQRALAW